MPEYMVKRYVAHDSEVLDHQLQKEMNEMAAERWTVDSMVTSDDADDSRSIVVTYKRET